jgi:hypothetical protein
MTVDDILAVLNVGPTGDTLILWPVGWDSLGVDVDAIVGG